MSRRDTSNNHAVPITDVGPSFDDEQRGRRRRYSILMAVHIAGFAVGGLLYFQAWWLGFVLIIATIPLPWVAVVIANSPRRHRGSRLRRLSPRKEISTDPPAGSGRKRTREDYERGLPDYHDPTAGIGGASPAYSALTFRAVLATFGLLFCAGAAVVAFVAGLAVAGTALAAVAAVAAVNLGWVLYRKLRGEPG